MASGELKAEEVARTLKEGFQGACFSRWRIGASTTRQMLLNEEPGLADEAGAVAMLKLNVTCKQSTEAAEVLTIRQPRSPSDGRNNGVVSWFVVRRRR